MNTPGDALAASTAAGAEAGTRAADTTTVACDLVRVGMFFDGTGNSRDQVGTSNIDSWHSNVDLLELLYKNSEAPEIAKVNNADINAKFGSVYIRGVGIETGGGNQQWGIPRGSAWGTGPEGVSSRTKEGIEAARQKIREKADGLEPCYVWLDAFGFSRGACVARDFANKIKGGAIKFAGKTARVEFMGLWDTVSSIGNAGNMGNWAAEDVRINTTGTAQHIVHITAKDELRESFPLTLAQGGLRIEMVGAHSDIGGGYFPGTTRGSVSYASGDQDAFFNTVARKWNLQMGEWQRFSMGQSRESDKVDGDQLSEMMVASLGAFHQTTSYRWEAKHGLQLVSLKIMYDQAVLLSVPFKPFESKIDDLSGDLLAYYNQIKDHPHTSDTATDLAIRRKYAHMSVGNSIGMGPEPSGTRRSSTM